MKMDSASSSETYIFHYVVGNIHLLDTNNVTMSFTTPYQRHTFRHIIASNDSMIDRRIGEDNGRSGSFIVHRVLEKRR